MSRVLFSRSELVQALEQVKGSVAQKNFLPILTHVLFAGDTVLGYDSEVGVRVRLKTTVPESFNVKATTFLELLKALEAEEVEVDITPKELRVKCGGHKSVLQQITEVYPKPEILIKADSWVDLPAGFKEAVERAMLGVSEDEQNKLLSALYIGDRYIMGGDGKQLVRCNLGPDINITPMLLGRRAVGELLRLGQPRRMAVAGPVVVFDYENLLFLARLREGTEKYPAPTFATLLNKVREPIAIPAGLINALGRLSLFGDGDVKHCAMEFGDLGLTLTARGSTGTGEEMFPPIPGPWSKKQGINAARAIPLMQFSESWAPGLSERDPIYFSGKTAGFEAVLAQSQP